MKTAKEIVDKAARLFSDYYQNESSGELNHADICEILEEDINSLAVEEVDKWISDQEINEEMLLGYGFEQGGYVRNPIHNKYEIDFRKRFSDYLLIVTNLGKTMLFMDDQDDAPIYLPDTKTEGDLKRLWFTLTNEPLPSAPKQDNTK